MNPSSFNCATHADTLSSLISYWLSSSHIRPQKLSLYDAWSPTPKTATFFPSKSRFGRVLYSQSSQVVPERSVSAPVCQVGAPTIKASAPVISPSSASPISAQSSHPTASAMYPHTVSVLPVDVE